MGLKHSVKECKKQGKFRDFTPKVVSDYNGWPTKKNDAPKSTIFGPVHFCN